MERRDAHELIKNFAKPLEALAYITINILKKIHE